MTIIVPDQPDGYDSNPIVRSVVDALAAFGGDLTRPTVVRLLPMWRHYDELTAREVAAVLARFPEGDSATSDPSTPPGVTSPGGGWLSGSMQSEPGA